MKTEGDDTHDDHLKDKHPRSLSWSLLIHTHVSYSQRHRSAIWSGPRNSAAREALSLPPTGLGKQTIACDSPSASQLPVIFSVRRRARATVPLENTRCWDESKVNNLTSQHASKNHRNVAKSN